MSAANTAGMLADSLPPGRWRKCACVLINYADLTDLTDRCLSWTNVDQPFCNSCERLHQTGTEAAKAAFTRASAEVLAAEEPFVVSANTKEQP